MSLEDLLRWKQPLQLIEALSDEQTAPQADRGALRQTEGNLGPKRVPRANSGSFRLTEGSCFVFHISLYLHYLYYALHHTFDNAMGQSAKGGRELDKIFGADNILPRSRVLRDPVQPNSCSQMG